MFNLKSNCSTFVTVQNFKTPSECFSFPIKRTKYSYCFNVKGP